MKVLSINNNNKQNFGHSIRVNLFVKNGENAPLQFVKPYYDKKLYKRLNAKIVNALNSDYYDNLRSLLNKPKKIKKSDNEIGKFRELIKSLFEKDNDYSMLNLVRSVYRRNQLGLIMTGPDVSIIENLQGAKYIGKAKSDAQKAYGTTKTGFVSELGKFVQGNMKEYAENTNLTLRSKNNREYMLNAVFKKIGKDKKGAPIYEFDSFDFHENAAVLNPEDKELYNFKRSDRIMEIIKETVQNQILQITGKRMKVNSLDKILYPKIN